MIVVKRVGRYVNSQSEKSAIALIVWSNVQNSHTRVS